ncbi:MAG: STAS domain-containing protein [Pseudomonadota bacterium]
MEILNIVLPDALKIDAVVDVKQQMDALVKAEAPVDVDAGSVASVDYSGVQLLVAFCREVESRGQEVQWASVSDVLRDAFRDVDAEHYLGVS